MTEFYDRRLPNWLSRYAKQWGGEVGQSDLLIKKDFSKPEDIPENLWETFLEEGDTAAYQWMLDDGLRPQTIQAKLAIMRRAVDARNRPQDAYQKVWSINLTPEMKAVIKKGQPLGAVMAPLLMQQMLESQEPNNLTFPPFSCKLEKTRHKKI